ncbi:MAG: damage-inducible protein DinB [Parvibaculum sp.]|uniref:DinB family protein n=1 Tax=Parvibaculum sp. TaxID=2024848 RepID=UPI0025DC7343|nr:DinB family protein [Parvibaculum sp.]MCE9648188.1 damage-inducible protein DinB [Parvibaculum sp.]
MPQTGAVHTLTAYNAWENDGLYSVLETVPEARALEETPIILAVLNHAYAVSRIFQAHILGKSHPYTSANPEDQLSLEEIAPAARSADRWYVDYVRSAKESDLDKPVDIHFTNGDHARMSRCEMVLHVVNHSSYHRGNIGIILMKNRIPVPAKIAGLPNFLASQSVV